MKGGGKLIGIVVFLGILYATLLAVGEGAATRQYHFILGQRIGLYGIITLAAGFVIITGNIDLSMGSVVAFCSTLTCVLLIDHKLPLWAVVPIVLIAGMLIGLINGLLVTYLRVQAFVVTLCGMFVYRGLARRLTRDNAAGLGTLFRDEKEFLLGDFLGLPIHFLVLMVLLALAAILLHLSAHGRCFFAIGSNERAARFSGIPTNAYKILAFVLCSTLTALYSLMFVFTSNQVQPNNTGNMDELYAIAGAVLGGLSLRGGEGTVCGVLIGTCIIRILPSITSLSRVSSTYEPVVIGLALLLGATVDELLRRRRTDR